MEIIRIFYLCLLGITISYALPTKSGENFEAASDYGNYASDASQILAINLLKSYIDIDGNQVHSPLGVAVELAVLAEAANGETYNEFNKVFGYPKERSGLRDSFKRILSKYQKRELMDGPSFQTWLYIYRNNTAREEYKQILRDHYFIEVKEISHDDYDWSEPNTSLELDAAGQTTTASNSKDVIGFETLKRLSVDDADDVTTTKDTYGEEVLLKEASKFDRVVDDKQYVEKPVILEEIKLQQEEKQKQQQQEAVEVKVEKQEIKLEAPEEKEPAAQEAKGTAENIAVTVTELSTKNEKELSKREGTGDKREDELNLEENETVLDNEKLHKNREETIIVPIQELLASNEPEKVSLPLQKLEVAMQSGSKGADEIMQALELHLSSIRRVFGGRSLFNKDDITSALSANSITGREIGAKTKMLLFNGLYYRGNWDNAFKELRDGSDQFFFMTADDAMKTTMMHAHGSYHMADFEHLNAKALCIPYENKKYTMMIIMPNDIEGLRTLVEKIQPADLEAMQTLGKEKDLHVILPKFQVEETSRSESMLKGLGLKKLFSRDEADLSLLSTDADLHVDEIVQFVNIRVDEGGSSEGALSAIDTHGRNSETVEETFEINRPFLYFVMDCAEKFVIVSGKINAPEIKDEEAPVTIEIEFEQT